MDTAPDTVAQLMAEFRKGDRAAANRLVELLYPELRRMAAAKMKGERAGHTWQPTLLVNELYLALVKIKALSGGSETGSGQEKAAFLGLAGHVMKRLLIDHSRPLYRRAEKVACEDALHLASRGAEDLQWVEQALSRLAAIDPKFRSVIEMRVFEGLTVDEAARQLGCSPRSVATYWTFAKRWLEKELTTQASVPRTHG
ncbi:ECF-type sigma factor [uncultured Paludibaculum sp.]|uniref:ECF-type sigma factor n=1 Tax=uncultured Paludibaculum sp. TaxID=1765020 RepID=UPI002AAB8FC1|nr:ECF-type sigma factor [uncultured Paludibaculum sp.]